SGARIWKRNETSYSFGAGGDFTSAPTAAAMSSVRGSAENAGRVNVMGRVPSAGKVCADCMMSQRGPLAKQWPRLLFPIARRAWKTSGGASGNDRAGRSDVNACGDWSAALQLQDYRPDRVRVRERFRPAPGTNLVREVASDLRDL